MSNQNLTPQINQSGIIQNPLATPITNLRWPVNNKNLNNNNMQTMLMRQMYMQNNPNLNNNFNNPNLNLYNQMLTNQNNNQCNSNINPNYNQYLMTNPNLQINSQNPNLAAGINNPIINPNSAYSPNMPTPQKDLFNTYNKDFSKNNVNNNTNNVDMIKLIQEAISTLKNKTDTDLIDKNSGTNNGESDISYGGLSVKNEFETQYSLEDENLKQLWSGFLTKNKKDKVCVDAYQIRHECSHFFTSEFNLNVSHRTHFEEIMKRPIIGVIAFSPQNETQCENFLEYINYFKEKDRAGVVNLKSQATMYIIPPGDFSRKFYQNPKKHLLGIFVDSTVDAEKYVDMNQLKLPPAVISSTEKKLLLKQQKNNNKINSNNQNLTNNNANNFSNNLDNHNFNLGNLNKQSEFDEIIKNMSNDEKGK